MNPVKNITISDARTGFLLLERKFRWPSHALSGSLGALAQSFLQFAREVDDGHIHGVVFEGKVRHSLTHAFTHSLTHSLTHSFSHLLVTHSLIGSLTYSLTHLLVTH